MMRMVHTLWLNRELLWAFAGRDLTVRYRYAVLGIVWAVATPLAHMLVFSVIFTRVARVDAGMPYPLYAFTGLAVWNLTASALRGAVTSLSGNAALVTKVNFHREVLPIASVAVAAVDFAVALPFVFGVALYYGYAPGAPVLLLPLLIALQVILLCGLGLLLAAANLLWRDVRHVFDAVILLWMFGSSVLYPIPSIGGSLGWVLMANPMTHLIDAYRDVMLRSAVPDARALAFVAVFSMVALWLGTTMFTRTSHRFAEVA